MKLRTAVILAGLLLSESITCYGQTVLNRKFTKEKLSERIRSIEKDTNESITFDATQIENIVAPAFTAKNNTVAQVLEASLKNTGYTYRKDNSSYIICRNTTPVVQAQPQAKQQQTNRRGIITGTVLDKDGFPIPGATIVVKGLPGKGTATDIKGKFTLTDVPARSTAYTVEVSCISYQPLQVSDVKVAGGKSTPLDVILQDGTEYLKEVVVTATYNKASANALFAKQKNMVAMSDGLSADLIKKTSDNNMAQVLRRVSGVTIDNGKYVNVRGMGERYNNVQLNGASLPSTEPNRRNFSFDIIPSGLVDNVTIAKTFTPDLPGEFTGGLVEVNTLAVPSKKFVNVSVGTGMNTQSTGKDFKSNQRFKSDWFFGNMNDRQWYAGRDAADGGTEKEQLSAQKAATKNTFGMANYKAMPLQNYSITVGVPFEFGYGQKIGFVGALTYRNEQNTEEYKEMLTILKDSLNGPGKRYKFVTTTGAVANIGWEMPNHKITWRNMFNNRFSHTNMERYIASGNYNDVQGKPLKTFEQYSVPLCSQLWQTQLEGEHRLFNEGLIVAWNASFSRIERTNPDDRYAKGNVMGEIEDHMVSWASSITNADYAINDGHLMYSQLTERKKNIGVNLERPFIVAGNKQRLKGGYLGTFRTSDYEQKYLHAVSPNPSSEEYQKYKDLLNSNPNIEELYDPQNFANGALLYRGGGMTGNKTDYYEGKQDIHAAYLMGEFSFFRKLHLMAGMRMESADTEVYTTFYDKNHTGGGSSYVDSTVVVKKTDWLPAASLVYNITDNINARFAYSRTIARPDFRELTPCTYYNVDDRLTVTSLGDLTQSHSDNFDLRFEWYPQGGEVVSVSVFYKKFKDPIEMMTRETSDREYKLYSFNIDDATVRGIEINLRKSLGFLAPVTFLKDLYLNGNVTFLKGDVKYNLDKLYANSGSANKETGIQDRKRPLQGLAPYTVNAGLTYQGKIVGASVNYGRSGRRLTLAGTYAKYDQYEASRDVLDLQLSARFFNEKLEFKFNASDLLNQDILIYRNCGTQMGDPNNDKSYVDLTSDMNYNSGDWVMSRLKKGINLSLSVGYKF